MLLRVAELPMLLERCDMLEPMLERLLPPPKADELPRVTERELPGDVILRVELGRS